MGNTAAPRRSNRRPPSSGSGVPVWAVVLLIVVFAVVLKFVSDARDAPAPGVGSPPSAPPVAATPGEHSPPPASPQAAGRAPSAPQAPPPPAVDPRPAPDDAGIAGTWETDDGAFVVTVRASGQFEVAAAVVTGDEIRFASGNFAPVAGEPSLWRGEVTTIDEAGAKRIGDLAARLYAQDMVRGERTSRARTVMLGTIEAFAAAKEGSRDPPGFFRRHGVLFHRLGRFKLSMIGPTEKGGTIGMSWSLRRVD